MTGTKRDLPAETDGTDITCFNGLPFSMATLKESSEFSDGFALALERLGIA